MERLVVLVLFCHIASAQYIINLPKISNNSLYDESRTIFELSVFVNDTSEAVHPVLILNITSDSHHVFHVSNKSVIFTKDDIIDRNNKSIEVVTNVIGLADVSFSLQDEDGNVVASKKIKVGVLRKNQTVDMAFTGVLAVLIFVATTFMGCGLDLQIVKENLLRPRGPVVGFICQFGFMPLISLTLGYFFFESILFRLGLFIIGCSPGGSSSNFWTILFNGDVNLSITMTFVSSVAAIGMMPLWVFIVTPSMHLDNEIQIPYQNLAISVAALIIPLAVGLLIRKYKRTWADFASEKLVKPVSFVIIIFVITMGTLNGSYLFKIWTWQVALSGLFLAWAGFTFGAVAAWIMRLERPKIIAISLETALQNGSIAYLVLKASLPSPYSDIAAMPAITALFMTGFTIYFAYAFYFAWGKVRRYLDRRRAKRRIRLDKPQDDLTAPLNKVLVGAASLPQGMPIPGDISPPLLQ